MRLHFIPIHVFRETPSVTFFDAGVPGSNGTDVVAHHGAATSPPDQDGSEQYYVHHHQVDNNLDAAQSSLGSSPSNHSFDASDGCSANPHRHLPPLRVQQRRKPGSEPIHA